MKNNYIYLRVSSSHQDESHQLSSIKNYCNRNNIVVLNENIIVDRGISAYKTDISEREGLMDVLSLASEAKIDKLLIFESSRISRRKIQMEIILNELSKYSVEVISITEGALNTDENVSSLLTSIRGWQSQMESKKLSERTTSAKRLMREQGLHMGGRVLKGFKVVNKNQYAIDEDVAPLIVELFNVYIQQGTKASLNYFSKTFGKDIFPIQLMEILKNKKYKGVFYNKYYSHLQVVDNVTWNKANDLIVSRRTNTNKSVITNRTDYLCESMLVCSNCMKKLVINTSKNSRSFGYRKRCNCLGQRSFSIKKVDKLISYEINNYLDNLSVEKLKEKFNQQQSNDIKKMLVQEKSMMSLLETKEKAIRNANIRLQEAFIEGYSLSVIESITNGIEELKIAINRLQDDIKDIQNKIQNEQLVNDKNISTIEYLFNFKFLYANSTPVERKAICRELIDIIEVGKGFNDINIKWKY